MHRIAKKQHLYLYPQSDNSKSLCKQVAEKDLDKFDHAPILGVIEVLPLQAAMLMPPLALNRISFTVSQHPQLTLESKAKLLEACMLILEAAQIAFFSQR